MKHVSRRTASWGMAVLVALFCAETLRADSGLEFSVTTPTVVVAKDGKKVNKTPQAGDTLYISCSFTGTGSAYPIAPYTPVHFVIQVDGKSVADTFAPVKANQPMPMGAFWTASSAGAHVVSCEVNPDKGYEENNYGDNKRQITIQVAEATPLASLSNQPPVTAVAKGQVKAPSTTEAHLPSPGQEKMIARGTPHVPSVDLVVEQIQTILYPGCSQTGPVLGVGVKLRNAGSMAVPKDSGSLVEVKPGAPLIASGMPVPVIVSGDSKVVMVYLRSSDAPSVLAGKTINLDVHVNANKAVLETNYANDSWKASFTFPASYCK